MTIGIDIDETITETRKNALKYLAKYDNKCLDYHNLPVEKYMEFMNLYEEEIIITNELKKRSKRSIQLF